MKNKIYMFALIITIGCKETSSESEKITYYENGSIKSRAHYKNDQLDGSYIQYYKDGTVQLKGDYYHGSRSGVFYTYHEKGILAAVTKYKDGEREGESYEFHPRAPIKFINTYSKDSIIKQVVLDTLRNELISLLENDHSIVYYENRKVQILENGMFHNEKYYKLRFDMSGKLKDFQGNLKMISEPDRIILDQSWPDWELQVNQFRGAH